MKKTELKRKTALNRGVTRLARVAKRKQAQYRRDMKWRDEYLKQHPFCEIGPVLVDGSTRDDELGSIAFAWCLFRSCTVVAIELHEKVKRGRGGSVTDENNVMACCRACHDFTETEVKAATELGLLKSNPKWRHT